MPSALIGLDKNGIITKWNDHASINYQIEPDKAIGNSLVQTLPYLQSMITPLLPFREKLKRTEKFRITRKKGDQFFYEELTVFPLSTTDEEGAVIRIDDITEQIFMQETMIQSEKMLSIGGLAAGMAHEINNPLAGIMQTSSVMQKRISDSELPANIKAAENAGFTIEQLQKYVEERGIIKMLSSIRESGKRAASIIQNMLKFSRREDSFSSHNPEEMLDLILELAATDFNLKKNYDFKNIKIVKEYDKDLPYLLCSEQQIQQVILNLLRNGSEAMMEHNSPDKHPKFVIRLKVDEKMLRIEIEDNGPGIAKESLDHIFDPFYTTKPVGVGTGLGLSVSHYIIVENHKGSLEASSEPGKGACFIMRIPLER